MTTTTEMEYGEAFTQSDWEFKLDTMHNPSHRQLQEHLEESVENYETAEFLRGYLLDLGISDIQ